MSASKDFRILKMDVTLDCFAIEREGETKVARYFPCMANFRDTYVFLISGMDQASVERYHYDVD